MNKKKFMKKTVVAIMASISTATPYARIFQVSPVR